jgi:hypothetical protein
MQDERDSLDTLIDDTASQLTAGAPSSALRENVRARLAPRRAWWQVPIWQPALGAAAAAVVAIVLMSPDETVPVSPVRSSGQAPEWGPASTGQTARPVVDQPAVVVADGRPVSTARSGEAGGRASRRVLPESNQVAVPANPLPPIEPLDVEPVPPIAFAVIERLPEPVPLRIERLQIERLSLE